MLRVAIAGYGTVGRIRHRCVDDHPSAKIVGVADETQSFEMLGPQVQGFRDTRMMIDVLKPDVVFIALPNFLAAPLSAFALERGCHVFCEKPPARNLIELQQVIDVESRSPGLHLAYGFNHRYHPSVKQALSLVRSHELGNIIDMRGVYGKSAIIRFDKKEWRCQREQAGGGILLDQGIHMVDMMRLMGGDFTTVHSFVRNSHWGHDVEDNAYALMRTDSGIIAMLHSSATQWRHRFQLDITLQGGAITLSGILSSTRSYGAETITIATPTPDILGDPTEVTTRFSHDSSWQDETDEFLDTITSERPPTGFSSAEAKKTMELVYAIYGADPDWSAAFSWDWN